MEIRLLGPVELVGADGVQIPLAGNKVRGLLAVLALEARHTVTPQRLIDTLWDEQAVDRLNVVQVLVSKLRRALADAGEANVVKTQSGGYTLDVAPETIDLTRFETFVEQSRTSHSEQAAELLHQALSLWHGTALSGVPDTERTTAMRARLEEQRRTAIDDLTDARLNLGRHHELVADLEALVVDDPLRERRWGQLIKALYNSGRQADAMRAFQRVRDVLVEQIGAEPGPELRRLEAAVLAQDDTLLVAVPQAGPRPVGEGFRRRGNVRHPFNRCLGREGVLAELSSLVGQYRLISLIGPGGVGKTRLAQEFGLASAAHIEDGVWWIDLAAARSGPDVATALQQALGIDAGPAANGAAAIDAVIAIIAERDALLIFDNCEHLVDDVRLVIGELLRGCARLRIVATSRESLDLAAERRVDVNPLAADAAVELFESRVADGIDVTGESAETIREICERLDRLPLALELAAARTRYLRLDEIRTRLSNRFELLGDAPRDVGIHQRNLRATAEWSYELLDAPERLVFERLSVFADGASVPAARAVCAGDGVEPAEVEHLLHRLVDKSLVVADRSGAATRFRMLQTLADYAAERLDARSGADRQTRRAHAHWVRDLASTVAFGEPTEGQTIAAVQEEDAAIRDAVGWALEHDPLLALQISMSLSAFWFGTMRVSSGWELLSASLDAATSDERLRAAAQAWAALFAAMLQDLDSAQRHADSALQTERRLGDPLRLGRATLLVALAASYRDDPQWAHWIDESRANFARAPLSSGSGPGYANFAAGAVELLEGDLVSASRELSAAIAEFREHRDHLGLILAVSRLGELAYRSGDIDLYAAMHDELFDLGVASRSSGVTTGALARLAHARLLQGDLAAAERLAREALAGSGASFMPVVNGYVLKSAGLVNLALGHLDDGRRDLKAAIEAFSQGTGRLGIGQAAMCWIDLSASYAVAELINDAVSAANRAVEAAEDSGEPWVLAQAHAHRQDIQQRSDAVPTAS